MTRRLRGAGFFILAMVLLAAGDGPPARAAAGAPEGSPDEAEAQDEDPTRTVLFNVRIEHRELLDGAAQQTVTLRRDAAIPSDRVARPAHGRILLRFDLPLSRIERRGATESGVGDLFAQAVRLRRRRPGFVLGYGSALIVPTASEDSLGSGKWTLAPVIVPVWTLPRVRGLSYVKVQDYFSVAGDGSRPSLHFLTVTPAFMRRLGRRGFMLVDTESRTNWREDGRTSWMSGVLVGRALNPRWGFWAKVEIPWGEHRTGDWTLRTSFVRREVR